MSKRKGASTTAADLVPVLAEWEQAIAHLKKARKSLRAWHRRLSGFDPELDYNAHVLVEKAKELERATRMYRSMFQNAKSRGYPEVASADKEYDPFS